MKKLFGIIGLATLLACNHESDPSLDKFKTIMIESYGEIETLPDMATFHIDLNCLAKSIQASKQCLVDKSNDLNSKLQSFGISKDDLLTTEVSLNKSYVWRNNSSVFEGYRSSATLFVTVKNIDKLDEIYTELLENRNLELGGLSYSHSGLDSLKNEAYVDALIKSGKLADKLIANLPESSKVILKIGNVEISSSLPGKNLDKNEDFYQAEVSRKTNNNLSISKGTVKVTATLFVEYQIQ